MSTLAAFTFNEHDVLLGRKKFCYEHEGNLALKVLIQRWSLQYDLADRKTDYMDQGLKKNKMDIRKEIVALIEARGGRFLKINQDGKCEGIAPSSAALDKVKEEFANVRRGRKSTLKLEDQKGTVGERVGDEEARGDVEEFSGSSPRKETSTGQEAPRVQSTEKETISSVTEEEKTSLFLDALHGSGASVASISSLDVSVALSAVSSRFDEQLSQISISQASGSNENHSFVMQDIDSIGTFSKPSKTTDGSFSLGVVEEFFDSCPIEISTASAEATSAIESKLQTIKDHIDVEPLVLETVMSLAKYTEYVENDMIVLAAGGLEESGIAVFIEVMKRYPTNWKIQRYGCLALGNLALNVENCIAISNGGGCQLIVAAMEKFALRKPLQIHCCCAIGNLSLVAGNAMTIGKSGGCRLVVESMNLYVSSEKLQRHGCYAIGNLSLVDRNAASFAQIGGVAAVMEAMQRFEMKEKLMEYGLYALGNLARNNEDNARQIDRAGGSGLIVSVMRAFAANETIQQYGCYALGNITAVEENPMMTFDPVVEIVVNAMENFPSGEQLQDNGCFALGNLASKEYRRMITSQLGGVGLVIEALRQFPWNEQLQRNACLALGRLANDVEGETQFIRKHGGIDLVIRALRLFPNSVAVQEMGRMALKSMNVAENEHDLCRPPRPSHRRMRARNAPFFAAATKDRGTRHESRNASRKQKLTTQYSAALRQSSLKTRPPARTVVI